MASDTPSHIGDYKVIAKIGEGGMAQVLLALKPGAAGFRKLVVLKLLRSELSQDDEYKAMFLEEARVAARMAHPNVVQTYEVGEENDVLYIAMEYLQGQSFSRVMRRKPELPLEARIQVLSEALAGLHHAHELRDFDGSLLNIVHRDVSPQNIFVTYDGQVQLLDFGVAKTLGASTNTQAGTFKGKVSYIAPEQALGSPVDCRADIFAMGVILWETVSRRRLAKGGLDVARLNARIQGSEPRLREIAPDADPILLDACDKAMALEPEDRFSSADEFRDALRPFLAKNPMTLEQIGAWMSSTFKTEREELRRRVESQVQAHEEELSSEIPMLSIEVPSTTTTSVQPKSHKARYLLAGAIFVVVCAVGAFALSTPESPPEASPQTAGPAPEPSRARVIALTIEAEPEGATLMLDGTSLANPFRAEVSPSGELHRIKVTAPGYIEHEQVIVFDRDQQIRIELEPEPEPEPEPAPDSVSAPRPAPPTMRPRRAATEMAVVVDMAPPTMTEDVAPEPPPAVPTVMTTTMSSNARPIDETDPYQ